jgi:hypothetical protein
MAILSGSGMRVLKRMSPALVESTGLCSVMTFGPPGEDPGGAREI